MAPKRLDESKIRQKVESAGHSYIFAFWDELSPGQRQRFLVQIARIDFSQLNSLIASLKRKNSRGVSYGRIEPAPILRLPRTSREEQLHMQRRREGENYIRKERIACLVVAGGQGTRLGFSGPKGTFPIGPVTGRSLFQIHSEKILSLTRRYGARIPWYIMTSPANHDETLRFFGGHHFFGLPEADVIFFQQGTLPAVDDSGRLVLDRKDHIFESPDGHGGVFRALEASGALADMQARGVEQIFYFQVDNPLVQIADPLFLGHHLENRSQMSCKVVAKRSPEERLGVVALRGGRMCVVEYSDLSREDMYARNPDGSLKFWAGSIAIHWIERSFIENLLSGGFRLPYHIAEKPIPCLDEEGRPDRKNGYKFETFIFDALPLAGKALALETSREQEFAPIKDPQGEDSPERARRLMINLYGRWLEEAGAEVPRDGQGNVIGKVEISPLVALSSEDLKRKYPEGIAFKDGLVLQ